MAQSFKEKITSQFFDKKHLLQHWINNMTTVQRIGLGVMGVAIMMLPISYAITDINKPKAIVNYQNGMPHIQSLPTQGMQQDNQPMLEANTYSSHPNNPNNTYTNTPHHDQSTKSEQHSLHTPPTQTNTPIMGNCNYYGGAAKVGILHYQFPEAPAADLVTYSSRHKVHRDAIQPLKDMVAHAKEEGVTLEVGSAFRSVDYQRNIVQKKQREGQSDQTIYKTSSHPGYSEHHTGFAVDFVPINHNFANSAAYRWLKDNASRYGFYQTFTPEYSRATGVSEESWHWKFTQSPTAQHMLANANCVGRGQAG